MTEEKKNLKQIAKGEIKEKGLGEKAAEAFLSEDTRTVKNYILWDVVIPAIKNTLADVVIGGIEMVLFGSSRGPRKSYRGGNRGHVSYENYYDRDSRYGSNDRVGYRDRDSRGSVDDIILYDRAEVEEVISTMENLVEKYGSASVSDLCSLCGVTSRPFTDNKWGWTDIRDFSFRRSGRGFVLDFAKPEYLGN